MVYEVIIREMMTKITINVNEFDNQLEVSFPFHPVLVTKAKKIWPYKWDNNRKIWIYPICLKREVYEIFNIPLPDNNVKSYFPEGLNPSPFLMSHQLEALKIAQYFPKFAWFFEMGTGKSIIASEIVKHRKNKALIIAPLSILKQTWEETFDKFYQDIPYRNLYDYKKPEREVYIKNDEGFIAHIINYETFKIHFDRIMKYGNYKTLIVDESSKLKGRTTDIAKKIIEFAQNTESVYLLSGCPNPNSNLELFPQIEAIAPGLLGYNFYSFRNRYFLQCDKNGFKFIDNQSMKQELINRLKKVCIFLKKEDIIDLPDKIFEIRNVEMYPEQAKIYNQLKNQFVAEVEGETIISPNVLSKINKLRQITSGFIYYNENSLKFSNAKVNELKATLEEIGNHQVIIWCSFKEEIKQLLDNIESSRAVYGEISQAEKDKNIKDFKDGKFKYLIANPASLAHGITLTNINYAIYYSLSYSSELFAQSQDRIHRIGQKNKCTYIFLNCKNTIDEVIYNVLHKKIEGANEILSYLKRRD